MGDEAWERAKKNPFETAVTGGLNIALAGPKKLKGFEEDPLLEDYAAGALARQNAIGAGAAQGYGQLAMNQNVDMANRAAMAMAASQRGASNPNLAFRQAQLSQQQNLLQGGQQAAIMAAQERQSADQYIGAQRAADRGVALQQSTTNLTAEQQNRKQNFDLLAGAGQAAASAASDENAKTDIKPAENSMEELEAFVESLRPSTYKYKDAKHGTGKKTGVMAQDLEKTAVGKTMVDTAKDGTKMVDTNKAIGTIMAAMADMSKKIKSLEK